MRIVLADDTALLRNGGSTTIAPLTNDFDPSGGILVLQSVSAPPDSGVTVTVVDHSLLQISAASTVPSGPVTTAAPGVRDSTKPLRTTWTVETPRSRSTSNCLSVTSGSCPWRCSTSATPTSPGVMTNCPAATRMIASVVTSALASWISLCTRAEMSCVASETS